MGTVMKIYILLLLFSLSLSASKPGPMKAAPQEPKYSGKSGTSLADNQRGFTIRKRTLIKYKAEGGNIQYTVCIGQFGVWEERRTGKVGDKKESHEWERINVH